MNHFYFYSKQILKVFEKHKEILNLISSIDDLRKSYTINPQEIVNIPTDQNSQYRGMANLKSKINSKNQEVLKVVRSKRPNKVYELINSFITDLNLFDNSYNDENSLIKLLKEFPENHTDAYSEKQAQQIFDVIETSSSVNQAILNAEERANYIIEEFEKSKKSSPDDYTTLTIGTDQDVPLIEDFVLIFEKLQGLYNFICYLHKIDSESKPILINQVSTGSWFSELLGIKQVIVSTENLLKGIGGFIRDYITGKISREKFENNCKKAEAFINLMALAKKNGIDNAELGIFKELNPFVENLKSDTTVLEVNEEEILKIKKTEKLTLADRKSKREKLIENIQLSIEEGKKPNKKEDNKK
ncbi:hypothetical protein [Aureibaculum conchae]|uniref:hypothetical protein n=1 Tax=Aureibaculum sp. 2308TA14-22 TaxID=3108392 RepID=UPI003395779E